MTQTSSDTHDTLVPPIDDALVRVNDARKQFGDRPVLSGVSCAFNSGEITVVIGRSGSGKSTLLRLIAGLTEPDSGDLTFSGVPVVEDGQRTRAWKSHRATVGMVFQSYTLWPHMSVLDNLTLAPVRVRGEKKAALRERAQIALEEVGMADHLTSRPHELSGGQRQRVAIARALMMQPKILLCDEITSALDPPVAAEVLGVLTRLKEEENLCVALVTHDMAFAAKAADRLLFFSDGRISVDASPQDAFGSTTNAELRQFIDAVRF